SAYGRRRLLRGAPVRDGTSLASTRRGATHGPAVVGEGAPSHPIPPARQRRPGGTPGLRPGSALTCLMVGPVRVAYDRRDRMSATLPLTYLARPGETAWSLTGQHTGLTDIPLTERGERTARQLGERLKGLMFARVFTSPLRRAVRTCELAGFAAVATVDPDLVEWNYGEYEGRRTAEIRAERPDWQIFRDGCPGGETPDQVGVRADRVVSRVRAVQGECCSFRAATS